MKPKRHKNQGNLMLCNQKTQNTKQTRKVNKYFLSNFDAEWMSGGRETVRGGLEFSQTFHPKGKSQIKMKLEIKGELKAIILRRRQSLARLFISRLSSTRLPHVL